MAKLYYKDKPVVGLDISLTGIKVMSVDRKKWLVTGYGSMDLDPVKVQEALDGKDYTYLLTSLTKLLKKNLVGTLASDHVTLSIPTSRTYTRTFIVPSDTEKHLSEAVSLEVEQYIPLPAETLYVDYQITDRSKTNITVSINAAPKVIVDRLVQIAEEAGLRVVLVEPSINSIARLLEATEDAHLPTVIVDIGAANTDIAVLDGSIRVTGATVVGGNTFTLDIDKKLKVPLENAHQMKVLNGLNPGPRQQKLRDSLSPSLDRIIVETRKVMRYYTERVENHQKLEQLLVVGSGSNVPGIGEFFTDSLVMPARVASPWQNLDFAKLPEPPKQFKPRYITVAGLASVDPGVIWK